MAFFSLIIVRLFIENILGFFDERSFFYFFFEFTHTFLFFLCAFLLLLPLVRFAGTVDISKATNILLSGFLIILTPPIIDTLIFRGGQFWSFYEFDGALGLIKRFFTLFGDTPNIGITYGVRIEVVIVTIALGLYTFLKSSRLTKALLVSLGTYTLLFILGTLPSWVTLILLTWQKSFLLINQNDVAALFLTPENIFARYLSDFRSVLNVKMSIIYGILALTLIALTFWRTYPTYFKALWNNARLPQLLYHGGLLFLGMALAFFFTETPLRIDFFHMAGAFLLLASVESAWLASVVVNDLFDIRIDQETNSSRPLIQNTLPKELYKILGGLFFITSLILSGIISFSALLALLGYQAIAWIYSAPPFRLKRIPLVATLLAAFAGILILVVGFVTIAPSHDFTLLPLPLLFFLFIAYALALPLKDFKDIAGDTIDRVYTLPVVLGITKAKLLMGSFLFLLYVASPLVLNARVLFLPAMVLGSITFWIIQKSIADEHSWMAYRKLPGNVLVVTLLYGLFIIFLLF